MQLTHREVRSPWNAPISAFHALALASFAEERTIEEAYTYALSTLMTETAFKREIKNKTAATAHKTRFAGVVQMLRYRGYLDSRRSPEGRGVWLLLNPAGIDAVRKGLAFYGGLSDAMRRASKNGELE